MGLTNLKKRKNEGQELRLGLEVQVHKMFASVIRFDGWKLMYPATDYVSNTWYVFWLRGMPAEPQRPPPHEWRHATLPLQVSGAGAGSYNLTARGVRVTQEFYLNKPSHLQLAIRD